nr:hypothetical protein [Actinopolymorpha pittospori]
MIAEFERHHLTTIGDRVTHERVTKAAVVAAEHCGDAAALSSAYLGHANTLTRHDPVGARDVLTAAIGHAERAADPLWLASTLNDLAGIHVRLGDYGSAHSLLRRSMVQTRRSESPGRDPAMTLSNFGLLAAIRGDLREGAASLREAARAYEEVGAERSQAYALITLAEVRHALGDAEDALTLLDRAVALARASGSHRIVEARIERAAVLTELGRLDAAEAEVAGLVVAAEGTEDPELVARACAARGDLRHRLGDEVRACRDHARAVEVATASKDQYFTMKALVGLARMEAVYDRDAQALSATSSSGSFASTRLSRGPSRRTGGHVRPEDHGPPPSTRGPRWLSPNGPEPGSSRGTR